MTNVGFPSLKTDKKFSSSPSWNDYKDWMNMTTWKDIIMKSFDKNMEGPPKLTNVPMSMNPKIVETWINETLEDAGHLDIPNIILLPSHKNPITWYGIDRISLTNAGIPNTYVDRIYRCLFVYSVGFFEMIKNCLDHT